MYMYRNLLSLGVALNALSFPAAGTEKNSSGAEAADAKIATRRNFRLVATSRGYFISEPFLRTR